MKNTLVLLTAAVAVQASPFFRRQAVTAAISPTGTPPPGCMMNYAGTFGIAVMNITGAGSGPVATKSDGQPNASGTMTPMTPAAPVKTISDGQPQASTGAVPVKTISDGQPQAPTMTVAPVKTISDGQPQAPTGMMTVTMKPINQIGDGQIQNPGVTAVSQISDGQIQAPTAKVTVTPVKTISDGQPQAATGTAIKTISDGQPQAPTGTAVKTISDGQPQAPTGTAVKTISDGQPQAATGTAVKTLSDGQPQASGSATGGSSATGTMMVACKATDSLQVTLKNGILTDNQGRTGYIAANYQFQFDGPPQAGAIYTAGWTACSNGSLALGGSNVFYQCLSGSFYNLYDRKWAPQCVPITINAINLINC